MAANTSKRRAKNEFVAILAGLNANAIDLVNKGKRTPEMIRALLRALQLFKENRLGQVSEALGAVDLVEQKRRRVAFHDRYHRSWADHPEGIPVACLKVSVGTSARMMQAGNKMPDSLRKIVGMAETEICAAIGKSSLNEIKQLLSRHGMYLGMPEEYIREAIGD